MIIGFPRNLFHKIFVWKKSSFGSILYWNPESKNMYFQSRERWTNSSPPIYFQHRENVTCVQTIRQQIVPTCRVASEIRRRSTLRFVNDFIHIVCPRVEQLSRRRVPCIVSWYESRSGAVHLYRNMQYLFRRTRLHSRVPPAKRENRNKDSDDTREPG